MRCQTTVTMAAGAQSAAAAYYGGAPRRITGGNLAGQTSPTLDARTTLTADSDAAGFGVRVGGYQLA